MINVARRMGDKVRVAANARGERTGVQVQSRQGVVVDMTFHHPASNAIEWYYVRFEFKGLTLFFDWVSGTDLLDI